MNSELFTEYEEIMLAIKELEEKRDALKPQLVEMIPEDTAVDTGRGTFTLKRRSTWKFSEATEAMSDELKRIQKEEKQEGTAKEIPGNPYIEYRASKN